MALHTPHLCRLARIPIDRTRWRRICLRSYASDAHGDPAWFRELRTEMLNRELPIQHDLPHHLSEKRLAKTLKSLLPRAWMVSDYTKHPVVPVGNHLIYFNPALPSNELLPDGTDALHSPGNPYVRRMWAGGSVQVNTDRYYDKEEGFVVSSTYACVERIKEVRLRGQDDAAKIFVTIERQFAKSDHLVHAMKTSKVQEPTSPGDFFQKQAREVEGWGSSLLIEERNLVFMKERSATELEAMRAGGVIPVRYLDPPGSPDFSYPLVPDRAVLFQFSALTFNAHAIHLDLDYSRGVEGHRNLLVHGPLSLMLMLRVIDNHLRSLSGARQIIKSIEYRNLAPLYCDEELRICGRKRTSTRTEDSSVYDIWIEGPTGGMAVKGTVHTAPMPKKMWPVSSKSKRETNKTNTDKKSSRPSDQLANLSNTIPSNVAVRDVQNSFQSSVRRDEYLLKQTKKGAINASKLSPYLLSASSSGTTFESPYNSESPHTETSVMFPFLCEHTKSNPSIPSANTSVPTQASGPSTMPDREANLRQMKRTSRRKYYRGRRLQLSLFRSLDPPPAQPATPTDLTSPGHRP